MNRFLFFTKSQRIGVFLLLLVIVILQVSYFFADFREENMPVQNATLLRLNKEVDSLRKVAQKNKKDTIYPFNPNYLTDYKAFTLGMTTEQIDKLLAFRKEGKFVNSAEEFQKVTNVSNEFLSKIAPYFKFPEWVTNRKSVDYKNENETETTKNQPKIDINKASKEDFMKINGIGLVFAERIIKYREKLQGFSDISQVAEIYGIENQVVKRISERFDVKTKPTIEKKNINVLNLYELAKIPYIKFEEAKKIIALRSEVGNFKNFDELLKISEFDSEKIKKIQIYLFID